MSAASHGKILMFPAKATVNGVAGYTFTVFVEDNGEPGRNDKFRVQITGPQGYFYDSALYALNLGLLDTGNIQVH